MSEASVKMANIRKHVVISGMVQGVFFRSYARETALGLGLGGWVRNRRDGRVEAVFEGEVSAVERMIEWCRMGPPQSRVSGVDVTSEAYTGEFGSFSIEY